MRKSHKRQARRHLVNEITMLDECSIHRDVTATWVSRHYILQL